MKSISIVLLVAAVIQITSTAPASDVATTTNTPLGPMDMDQLVEYYIKDRYHRHDDIAPAAISLIKAVLEKLDDIVASSDNSDAETEIFHEFRSHFADFLKDVEDDTTECSLRQVVKYHHRLIREFIESEDNKRVRDLFTSFDVGLDLQYRDVSDTMGFIYANEALMEEVRNKVKFSTKCCKYWHESHHKGRINGRC